MGAESSPVAGRGVRHLAIIMDGNRRWARLRGAVPWVGHEVGFAKVLDIVSWAEASSIGELTLWMLSTDNLGRSVPEVEALVPIIGCAVDDLVTAGRYTVRHIGNVDVLPSPLREKVENLPRRGAGPLTVNLAIGHGGVDEIEVGIRRYLRQQLARGLSPADVLHLVDEESIDAAISSTYTTPDLVIRTSGERRLSGFLLWKIGGARFFVVDRHWPDFSRQDFLDAITSMESHSSGATS